MFSLPVRYENMREIPYPYKSMLAISSDAEYTSQEILDWLITYLNTTENTALGRGLGLEFAASLFFILIILAILACMKAYRQILRRHNMHIN